MTATDLAPPMPTSTLTTVGGSTPPMPEPPTVELVVPVYNEVEVLRPSIERLHAYLADCFPLSTRVTVADNGRSRRSSPGTATSRSAAG